MDKKSLHTNNCPFLLPHDLEPYLKAFSQHLSEQGFTPLTIHGYIDSISHFGTWLWKKEIPLAAIDNGIVSRFARHRCYCPGARRKRNVSRKYVNRVRRFVEYLSEQGVIADQFVTSERPRATLVVRFREHLKLRGLSPPTIARYDYAVTNMLPLLGDEPRHYNAIIIKNVVLELTQKHSLVQVKSFTTALRAYLRFLAVESLCPPDLDCAVPAIAHWSLSSMPRYITAEEVEQVIDSCDVRTTKGLRDRAILLLLSRLGLRAGDIVNMLLADINWVEGTLCIKGKAKRADKLPLPQDVGDAILAYLHKARPPVALEHVFLCLNAPYRPFTSSPSVSGIVDAALTRAGITHAPSRGAHLLRHSAATNMLRSGATLEAVSSILRHRSLDMTAYYAKVDFLSLQRITQPWPEETSC